MGLYLKAYDIVLVPVYLVIIYFISSVIVRKNIEDKPYYKYFKWGLFAKIFAGLAFCMVYLFYYDGGDTTYYFRGAKAIFNMAGKDFSTFLSIMVGNRRPENFSMFDISTGWPTYYRDSNAFAVNRFSVPFYMLGLGSYLGTTIVLNLVLYTGVWSFYKMVNEIYPKQSKQTAIALLFIPSVVFWSSGLLKDGWTYTAVLISFSSFYHIIITKQKIWRNIIWLLIWSYISFSIRPFVFYVTVGSGLVWVSFSAIRSIQSAFIRTIAMPFIILVSWLVGVLVLAQVGTFAGSRYSSVDAMVETAWIIQDDLKKDYYGGNSFDIGEFEPTILGMLSKAPKAIIAGTLRPFIWEGNGILLLFSGLENLILLLLIIYIFIKKSFFTFISTIYKSPFLLSLFVFAITFAFVVGLTTANFGALVRYRIPVLPFLLIVVFSTIHIKNTETDFRPF